MAIPRLKPRVRRQRRQYLWRRLTVLMLLLALLTGLYFGIDALLTRFLRGEPPAATANLPALSFKADQFLTAGDVDGDGQPERIALGPVANALRQVALVTGPDKAPKQIGEPLTLPAFDLAMTDLPRAKGLLVMAGQLRSTGQPKPVTIGGEKAVEAAGGEPSYRAWRPDPVKGLADVNYYELAAPLTPSVPTEVLVDKYLNVLWYYEEGKLVYTFRVATGKHIQGPLPTAATAAQNNVTPLGKFVLGYRVPGEPYYKENIPAGDPRNPLGTRFMGFSVYAGDSSKLWAIHGTNDPDSIGKWVSDGCIRLTNPEVETLYARVKKDTVLEIISSQKR